MVRALVALSVAIAVMVNLVVAKPLVQDPPTESPAPAETQPTPPPPPDIDALRQAWPAMDAKAFIESTDAVYANPIQDQELLKRLQDAIAAESARRLVTTNIAAEGDYMVVVRLAGMANLTKEQTATLRETLSRRTERTVDLSMDELQGKLFSMVLTGVPPEDRQKVFAEWLEGRNISDLTQAQVEMCCYMLPYFMLGATKSDAQWTGSIRPTQSGQFKFSASPFQIGINTPRGYGRSRLQVWVGGNQVLDTAKDGQTGAAVALTAGQEADLRVEFSHTPAGPTDIPMGVIMPDRPIVAMLYWEGPNTERQLVPAEVLMHTGDSDGGGLLRTYEYQSFYSQDQKAVTFDPGHCVDREIDFVGGLYQPFAQNSEQRNRLVNELNARLTTSDAFNSSLVNSAQRRECLRKMWADTERLAKYTPTEIRQLYFGFRPGAEQESLELLGKWLQTIKLPEHGISYSYFQQFRQPWFDLADVLTYEHPGSIETLENDYLLLPDGKCSLATAYILTYANAFQGRLDAWIERLDARLADESLTGDRRAVWLLARAHAEEQRGGGDKPQRYAMLPERLHAGIGWLDEASLVAESEAMQLRVLEEKIARLAYRDNRQAIADLLAQSAGRFSTPESAATIQLWNQQLDSITQTFDSSAVYAAREVNLSYVAELQRRLERAEQAGKPEAVARYRTLIEQATPPAEPAAPTQPQPPN